LNQQNVSISFDRAYWVIPGRLLANYVEKVIFGVQSFGDDFKPPISEIIKSYGERRIK
jgi:hypothetical protein